MTDSNDNCAFCALQADDSDPTYVTTTPASRVLVNFDQTYPGRVIVIVREHYESVLDIPNDVFVQLNGDMLWVAHAVQTAFKPERLNFAILGNVIRHVHWHIIPRYSEDLNCGRAPWPIPNEDRRLSDGSYRAIATKLARHLVTRASGRR